ncbi:MAG: 3'(2'),5'-bisphosphate nucleotidase CysQ [Deltaproteobacteria bacterium]|nr:3'(2'),5'-bisphosphate nucleotidase CysQ [Deltaproteobacteria bacterium]
MVLHDKQLKQYLLIAVRASMKAASAIMGVYSRADFNVDMKSDDSPLTDADRKAHEIIVDALKRTPVPILSEEGRDIPYDERKGWNHLWIVDPLDGTKEFIKRNGEFTVNIALVQDGNPVFGVIYAPVLKRLYFGGRGLSAYGCTREMEDFPGDLDELIKRCEKLPLTVSRSSYVIMGSRSHATPELTAFVEKKRKEVESVEFISAGSSLKICRVAEGAADIYPRLGPTMEWDTAAGQGIVEGAGRSVTVWETREPLKYNREDLLNPWFVVQ